MEWNTSTETQTAQTRHLSGIDPFTPDQDLKILSQAGRGDQVFELQCDFCAFLRQPALFKCIRELIIFSDSHQKLGLSEQGVHVDALGFAGG